MRNGRLLTHRQKPIVSHSPAKRESPDQSGGVGLGRHATKPDVWTCTAGAQTPMQHVAPPPDSGSHPVNGDAIRGGHT